MMSSQHVFLPLLGGPHQAKPDALLVDGEILVCNNVNDNKDDYLQLVPNIILNQVMTNLGLF